MLLSSRAPVVRRARRTRPVVSRRLGGRGRDRHLVPPLPHPGKPGHRGAGERARPDRVDLVRSRSQKPSPIRRRAGRGSPGASQIFSWGRSSPPSPTVWTRSTCLVRSTPCALRSSRPCAPWSPPPSGEVSYGRNGRPTRCTSASACCRVRCRRHCAPPTPSSSRGSWRPISAGCDRRQTGALTRLRRTGAPPAAEGARPARGTGQRPVTRSGGGVRPGCAPKYSTRLARSSAPPIRLVPLVKAVNTSPPSARKFSVPTR